MRGVLVALVGTLVIIVGIACGSSSEESAPAAAQVADLSQFPTPTRSQAEPRPTSPPPVAQSQTAQDEADTIEAAPMTQEEIQQLRQQMQSGQLSEEEVQQAIQRLRAQFGGGQGGPFGARCRQRGSRPYRKRGMEDTITVKTELASVTASVGEDTNVRITSILDPATLNDGSQVMVISERVEGSTLARVITISPRRTRHIRRQTRLAEGGFGAGQGIFGGGLRRRSGQRWTSRSFRYGRRCNRHRLPA